jgi:hypothetical protein
MDNRPERKNVTGLIAPAASFCPKTANLTMEVDVERCPFRPQRQKQEHHMLSDFVAHLILKNIGAREPRQGEIMFLAPKIYLLANTHTLTQKSILKITLNINVHTHAQGYSRSLRSQITLQINVHTRAQGYSRSLRSQIIIRYRRRCQGLQTSDLPSY